MIRTRFAAALTSAIALLVTARASSQSLQIEIIPDALEAVDCPGSLFSVTLHLRNPTRQEVGGFQAFLRYPTQYFEAVRYDPLAIGGSVVVNGRPPLGDGYEPCGEGVNDAWGDGAGLDVAAVLATIYGGGSAEVLKETSADLGRFVFRPRGEATDSSGAEISLVAASCSFIVDQTTRVFGPEGESLDLAATPAIKVVLKEGGPFLPSFLCSDLGASVRLQWEPAQGGGVRGYKIYRNSQKIRDLNIPGIFELTDSNLPDGDLVYEISVVRADNLEGCRSMCKVERQGRFIRGDADRRGGVTLTDAVAILDHLFRGKLVTCDDAADADDNGRIDLTDAVAVLGRLFLGAPGLPPPYPDVGIDPTQDSLGCDR